MQSCVCRPLWMELCQNNVISQEDNSLLTLYIEMFKFFIFSWISSPFDQVHS